MSDSPDSSLTALIRAGARETITELVPELQRLGLPIQPEWLSPEAAAVYTNFPVKSLEQMRRHGEGATYSKVGGRIRYRRSDLDAWLASHAVEPKGGAQ